MDINENELKKISIRGRVAYGIACFERALIFYHCKNNVWMPMIDEKNNPIFSIHGVDVICYGTRIDEYFQIEFGEKKQESIKYSEIKQVPFWTEMI